MIAGTRLALLAVASLFVSSCTPTFALAKEIKIAEGLGVTQASTPAVPPAVEGVRALEGVKVDTVLGTPWVLAGQRQRAFLKVGLEGVEPPSKGDRAPLNLAIVLDKSSSMAGDKIREAKRAATMAVNVLDGRDVVSVVTYDSTVSVIVPARRVTDKANIIAAIANIEEGGSTALFAGVSKGAAELRKLLSKTRVNRIILLSDGMANIGPASPGELADLGISLAREGISVTTLGLGLGYNEDLMTKLAMASDGNHAFVESASELAHIFELEFGDAMSVVAQDVEVEIELAPGVRPVRVLGREATIHGQRVVSRLNQVVAGYEKYILLEVELPPRPAGAKHHLAHVGVAFDDLATLERGRVTRAVSWHTTRSPAVVDQRTNPKVEVIAVEMLANEQNKLALALRDDGQVEEARRVLEDNEAFLRKQSQRYRSKRLKKLEEFNRMNADNLEGKRWKRSRKIMRQQQFDSEMQTTLY